MSLPVRGAWIEIGCITVVAVSFKSLPVRGAWIEIPLVAGNTHPVELVAPRAGSVD